MPHELTAYLSVFNLFLTQWFVAMLLSKRCKPDNFEQHNSLKLSFTNIQGLHFNFVECESFLESYSPNIPALCETNLDDSNWFWQFLCKRLSSFSLERLYYSYAWSCSLCERRTSFCMGLVSRKLFRFLLFFSDWLYFAQCLTSFSSINHLHCYVWLLILFHLT